MKVLSRGKRSLASVAVAVAAFALTAAPAQAEASASTTRNEVVVAADPKQGCVNIGNGVLCVHIWGNAGQHGRIAVSYDKRAGAAVYASLRWYNRSTGAGRLLVSPRWMTAGNIYSNYFDTFLGPHRNVAILEVIDTNTGRITQTFISTEVRL